MRERTGRTCIQTNGFCLLRLEVFFVVFGTLRLLVEPRNHGATAEGIVLQICFLDTLLIFLGYEGLITRLFLMSD